MFLASHASKVHVIVRRSGLAATMSRYLVDRIEASPNIEVHAHTEVVALHGTREDGLQSVTWRDSNTGAEVDCPSRHVFVFIGADPNADWLKNCELAVDSKGFVLTGADAPRTALSKHNGSEPDRAPMALETNIPGVFAIGDVRAGSVKRVASAVGEGAAVVAQLHSFLAGGEL